MFTLSLKEKLNLKLYHFTQKRMTKMKKRHRTRIKTGVIQCGPGHRENGASMCGYIATGVWKMGWPYM